MIVMVDKCQGNFGGICVGGLVNMVYVVFGIRWYIIVDYYINIFDVDIV